MYGTVPVHDEKKSEIFLVLKHKWVKNTNLRNIFKHCMWKFEDVDQEAFIHFQFFLSIFWVKKRRIQIWIRNRSFRISILNTKQLRIQNTARHYTNFHYRDRYTFLKLYKLPVYVCHHPHVDRELICSNTCSNVWIFLVNFFFFKVGCTQKI